MFIKVTKIAENPLCWWNDHVGDIFEVESCDDQESYLLIRNYLSSFLPIGIYSIHKDFCVEIKPDFKIRIKLLMLEMGYENVS